MQIPMGTQLTLHARANKELVRVQIDFPTEKTPRAPQVLETQDLSADRLGFSYAMEPLMQDTTLVFTLFDSDGIQGREPVRLSLVAVPDMPPQVAVRLSGIGSAITPQARLPVSGRITDDYGIARVWFEYAVDRQAAGRGRGVARCPSHPAELTLTERAMEVGPLNLKPGQKLLVALKAADLCNLPPAAEPNVGTSERWLLDVVSPEQLRAMLEAREVVLRWRFKAIVEEVTQTRDLLLRTRFGQTVGTARRRRSRRRRPAARTAGQKDGKDGQGKKGGKVTAVGRSAAAPFAGVKMLLGGGRWSEGVDRRPSWPRPPLPTARQEGPRRARRRRARRGGRTPGRAFPAAATGLAAFAGPAGPPDQPQERPGDPGRGRGLRRHPPAVGEQSHRQRQS